jgi:hypothetical protein
MGELACFNGLKFKMAVSILFAIDGRVLIKSDNPFKVALIKIGSLGWSIGTPKQVTVLSYLEFSWNTLSSLSSKPEASASRFGGGIRG